MNIRDKIRFKGCWAYPECSSCPKEECKRSGNYDLSGWRYDTIKGITQNQVTTTQVFLHPKQIDLYTYDPPHGIIPIL
ncbi:MAG TPA: hypothetical protein VI911_10775 [Patescibacteria group bacterium]|nr:hypothetical protein [Patescibacteria group bacterium]